MTQYPITEDIFTKSDCYRSTKKSARTGIQVHSVGCKGTLMARWKKSWNAPGRTVCGNYIIDTNGIYRVLPEGKRCWLSGSGKNGNANNTHLGFEICEPLTKNDTPEVAADLYGKTLYLCVYLCRMYGISPANVQAHYELHALGLASNHADVRHWWGKKGTSWEPYTMDTLRRDIAAELGESYVKTLKRGSAGPDVVTLQKLLNDSGASLETDGNFGVLTEAALKEYQRANGLEPDGVCGSITWASINAAVSVLGEGTVTDVPLTLEQRVAALELKVAALEAK